MFNIIVSGMPKELGLLTRVWFFGGRHFTIGGKTMTLYGIGWRFSARLRLYRLLGP